LRAAARAAAGESWGLQDIDFPSLLMNVCVSIQRECPKWLVSFENYGIMDPFESAHRPEARQLFAIPA